MNTNLTNDSIERRDFFTRLGAGAGTLAALSATGAGIAAVATAFAPADAHAQQRPQPPQDPRVRRALNAAAACLRAGEACVAHCMRELAAGHVSMAKCNARVHDMVAGAEATLKLLSYGSPAARPMVALMADLAAACRAACFEHSSHWPHGMHLECKACFESCTETEAACRALLT